MTEVDLSVVVSTYNRADRLPLALESVIAQEGGVAYEVIVVDNNSTDDTRAVVERLAARSGGDVRYAFEPRQGLSHARNTGIALSRGKIIAFTDDDVRAAPNWVLQLKRTLDAHPDVAYIGGRVLPNWMEPPPSWLTKAHWGPLALQDYGDQPIRTGQERAMCLVGANMAFRREVFERVGDFTPSLGRIKDGIGSTEDHDMQLRIWGAGLSGIYSPDPVVTADVTPDRLLKEYHRRWHRGNGRHCALMRVRELVPTDVGPMSRPQDIVKLFGAPAFVYADLARYSHLWLRAALTRDDTFFYANQLRHVWSYIQQSYRSFRADSSVAPLEEIKTFVSQYLRKRTKRQIA